MGVMYLFKNCNYLQRCPLEKVVLNAKLLDMGEPKALLSQALSPPNLDDIEYAVLVLKEVRIFQCCLLKNNRVCTGDAG